jgi:rod shape-determining protein MreD
VKLKVTLRVLLVIIAVVAIQASLMVKLRIDGAHPEIVWLLPITAALLGGAELGAIVGFISGIAMDCLLPTPFGLTAFVGVLVGFSLGQMAERTGLAGDGGVWWLLPALGAGLGAACVVAYDAFGIVLGEDQFTSVNLGVVVAVVAVVGGILIIPVWMAMGWAVGSRSGARRARTGEVSW